jgi:hypothetical protein
LFPPQVEIQRAEACAIALALASHPGLPERLGARIIGAIVGNKKEVISVF